MRTFSYFILTAYTIASLTACGFHLRGLSEIPFKSVYIQGNTLTISTDLKKSLNISNVMLLPSAEGAELLLELVGEEKEKRILSLAGTGTVNEYELYYRVHYRTKLIGEPTWSQINTIESRRDFTYSNQALLAKNQEEEKLNENMHRDVIDRIMRKITALKKQVQ